jgi:drug/metabolite transporter (DMT)-like permease
MNQKSETWLIFLTVLAMFFWGLSWPSGKVLSAYGTPVSIAFLRYVVIFSSSLALMLILRKDLRVKKSGLKYLIPAGLLLASYNYVFISGLQVGFANAGGVLVTTLNPIFAYSIGLGLAKRWPIKNESTGLILGLIGGAFQLNIWTSFDNIFKYGNMFFLAGALIWAVMSKFTSKAAHYGSSLAFSLWMYLVALLGFFIIVDLSEIQHIVANGDMLFWLNLLYFGFIATTVATSFYFYATTKMGAERASSFIFLVPISAALSSGFFLGETIENYTIFGGILGMLAVFIINYRKRKKQLRFNPDQN